MTYNTQELDEILDGLHESGCSVIEGMSYPRSVAAGMYKCDCGVLDAKQAILDWHNKQVKDPFDYIEPCEPDCSPERHAYHQAQWDMAHRMADLRLTTDKLKESN